VFTRGHRLSRSTSIAAADLIVVRGDWWAVWNENSPAPAQLMQARTYGRDLHSQRVRGVDGDYEFEFDLALAWRPGGGAFLISSSEHWWGSAMPDFGASIYTSLDGRWTAQQGIDSDYARFSILTQGRVTYFASTTGNGLVVGSNSSGQWRGTRIWRSSHFFETGPRLAAAPGRLLVACLLSSPGGYKLVVGERRGSGWKRTTLTPGIEQTLVALVMRDRQPTVLGISHKSRRLFAITGSR
jgi:hypothetical protein